MSRKIVRTTSLLSFILGVSLPFSVSAVDLYSSFTIEYQTTVYAQSKFQAGHLKSSQALANKPFVQLMQLSQSDIPVVTAPKEPQMGLFSVAMQVQDKVHYYMDRIEATFSSNSNDNYEPEECKPKGFANVAKFFSF